MLSSHSVFTNSCSFSGSLFYSSAPGAVVANAVVADAAVGVSAVASSHHLFL